MCWSVPADMPLLPLGFVFCLVSSSCPKHAGDQTPRRVAEVYLSGDGSKCQTVSIGQVDDILQLPG